MEKLFKNVKNNNFFYRNEGPYGLIICPSRELAKQTHDIIQHFVKLLRMSGNPEIRSCLAIGGEWVEIYVT